MSVTIKDIANIANVSHTTVSRALNDSPLINPETRDKIKTIAHELNYTPNYSARSLVLEKSYNIGLFFSTITKGTSSHFFHDVVKGVNHIIKDKYSLIVKGIDDYQNYNLINKNNFDGIIVMTQSTKDNAFIYRVLEKNIPTVVLNREVEEPNLINILSDDKRGAYKAVRHLIENGHRKIAIIEGQEGFKSTLERKEGYMEALMDNGISISKAYIVKGNYDLESGYRAMQQLLQLEDLPTAVFCSNDDMAVGAMKALGEKGISIPDKMSLIGFDDNIFTSYLTPALTTIKRPIEKISKEGAEKLIQLIEGIDVPKERIYLKTELVQRESVRAIK